MAATWTLPAEPAAVGQMRRHATGFAAEADASEETRQAIALVVSETVTNAVVLAYAGREPGPVSLCCRVDGARVIVEVADAGAGMTERADWEAGQPQAALPTHRRQPTRAEPTKNPGPRRTRVRIRASAFHAIEPSARRLKRVLLCATSSASSALLTAAATR